MNEKSKPDARQKGNAAAIPTTPILPADEKLQAAGSCPPESGFHPAGLNDRSLTAAVCVFLAAAVWAVFGQTLHHDFVNYDDQGFVYENPVVQKGLTWEGVRWAFTHVATGNWHPLTWLSHMLDCEFYGLNAGGHHFTSVVLHAATAILLFLVLRRMTGFLWRSAFAAAVFAIHPLRVESVAWVAERKDVLSGVFFMLTIGMYVRYARASIRNEKSKIRFYATALLLFTLGLICKPMLVTLPVVLLLLDYWPLNRVRDLEFGIRNCRALLMEKVPFFVLSAVSCLVTIFAQRPALQTFESYPFPLRLENALTSCAAYLGQMFWPANLAVLYPYPSRGIGVANVALSLVLLAGITTGAFVLRRRCPWVLTGWLWYLIMLMPVIGIIQVGAQAHADRYTYLPQIGLYLALTWTVADLCSAWRLGRVALGCSSAIVLVILILCARQQASYWQNSGTLWTHALACTSDNFIGENNLGGYLLATGKKNEAIVHYQRALQIRPKSAQALGNLGSILAQNGDLDGAIAYFQKALQISRDDVATHRNLGAALLQKGDAAQAIVHFQKVVQIKPDSAQAHYDLGNALFQTGKLDDAATQCQMALQINPDYADAHLVLGDIQLQKNRADEAKAHYEKVLQIKPDSMVVLNNLAWILATSPDTHLRNGAQAVQYAERACKLTRYTVPSFLGTLAAAYAETGRFNEATATAQKARDIAQAMGQKEVATKDEQMMELYQSGHAFHTPPAAP